MSNDRELLELAAKAAGVVGEYESWTEQGFREGIRQVLNGSKCYKPWNPLTDDGDAFRLAVKLGISLTPYPVYRSEERHAVVAKQRRSGDTMRELNPTEVLEAYGSDPNAATRRAIVRAAAEIGRAAQ